MIHACPEREWYVNDFLIPSMLDQGISRDEIVVWLDRSHIGNLASCLASFAECWQHPGETWHLQDDVIISRNFAERTRAAPEGIVCGFCVKQYEDSVIVGTVMALFMWQSSFPCIKIPNELAGEFVRWLDQNKDRPGVAQYVQTGKKDDTLFRAFVLETRPRMMVTNITPHLVDHVDHLIGGSIANQTRGFWARACLWTDDDLITELQQKLADRRGSE